MKTRIKTHSTLLLIALEAIIMLTIVTLSFMRPLYSVTIPLTEGTPSIGHMEEDGYYFTMEDGERVSSPGEEIRFHLALPVPEGTYTLAITYASGAGSKCGLTAGDPSAVECDDIALNHALTAQTENVRVLHDVSDLDFYVKYCGFKTFYIESATLTGNRLDTVQIFFQCLFVFFIIDVLYYLWRKKISPFQNEGLAAALIILGFTCLVSAPFYGSYLPLMDDFAFSYIKIEGIKDGLLDGQLPVRLHPGTQLGYGYALSCFYPELFLYFPAILRIIGFSIMDTYKIFVFFVNLSTAAIAYYSFQKVFRSAQLGILGSFLYTFSIYRLIDVYRRASIGEYLAMMFLPLVIAGFYLILTNDTAQKQYRRSFIPLMLGFTGLASSHILSCEMAGIFSVLACLICAKKVFQKQRFLQLLKATAGTLLLTLYFWVPFFDMLRRDTYKVFTQEPYSASVNALHPLKLLMLFVEKNGTAVVSPNEATGGDFALGIVLLTGSIAFLIIYLGKKGRGLKKEPTLQLSLICCVLGIFALYMTTIYFPWASIETLGGPLKSVLCMVQFPWRYLSIASALLTFTACGFACQMVTLLAPRKLLYMFAAAVTGITLIQTAYFYHSIPEQSDKQHFYDDAGLMIYRGTGMGEYEPDSFRDVDVDKNIWETQEMMNPDYVTERDSGTGLVIESFKKEGTDVTVVVANYATEERILYFPLIYYYGYRIENIFGDGAGLSPKLIESEKGTLAAIIPGNYYNGIHITYKEPLLYRTAEAISLLAFLCFSCYLLTGTEWCSSGRFHLPGSRLKSCRTQ